MKENIIRRLNIALCVTSPSLWYSQLEVGFVSLLYPVSYVVCEWLHAHESTTIKLVWPFTLNAGRENGKNVYKWKPMTIRPQGRPKKKWEDDIRNDMKKLKVKNWIGCIQDRSKWESYVEKAKIFKEWSCSAWRRRQEVICMATTVY